MASSAVSALAIFVVRDSAAILQICLMVAGFSYGVTDSGMTLLTIWEGIRSSPATSQPAREIAAQHDLW